MNDDPDDDNYGEIEVRMPEKGQGRNPWYSRLEHNIKEMTANAAAIVRQRPELHPSHPNCEDETENLMANELLPELAEITQSSVMYEQNTLIDLFTQNPELASFAPIGEDSDDFVEEIVAERREMEGDDLDHDDLERDVIFERTYRRVANELYDAVRAVQENERRVVVAVTPDRGIRLVGIIDVHEWSKAAGVFRTDTL